MDLESEVHERLQTFAGSLPSMLCRLYKIVPIEMFHLIWFSLDCIILCFSFISVT